MSKSTAAPTVYAIPEQAHFALVQINYFLRLMAYLTETGTKASSHDARLRPDSLGWCFSGLAKEIDAIVGAIHYSDDIARSPRPGKTKAGA